jgi:ABC-type uncharacterized transport system substrate-binding protein
LLRDVWRKRLGEALLIGAAVGFASDAVAHPHVWATVRSEILFGPDKTLTGIRQIWTFDEFYSAMAVQGLDADGDGVYSEKELDPLAKVNVESLEEFAYFTFVREEGKDDFLSLKPPEDYSISYDGTLVTLRFTLPLQTPADPESKPVTVDVYDPSFFVAFGFAEKNPVTTVGDAPGCTATMETPDAESAEAAKALTESFFSQLGPGSDYGSQFAQTVTVMCGAP